MKRASYREAVAWVAENDSGGDLDAHRPEVVQHLITTVLVADIFGVDQLRVGRDVVRYRRRHSGAQGLPPLAACPDCEGSGFGTTALNCIPCAGTGQVQVPRG